MRDHKYNEVDICTALKICNNNAFVVTVTAITEDTINKNMGAMSMFWVFNDQYSWNDFVYLV